MKKITLAFALLAGTFSFAQTGKWGIQLNNGAHFNGELGNGLSLNAGITYNHTANIQTKLDAGIDYLGQDNLSRMTLQIGADVVGMANAESKVGLLVHGGVGLLNNGNMVFNDSYLLRGDDMFALTFGLSPKIKINEHSGILLDWSYAKLYKIDGDLSKYMTGTVGFYYRW
ncbi:MAG: hypothetical protein RL164_1747 [Bacteroidota bacterium]|jgi:hypothetical protein